MSDFDITILGCGNSTGVPAIGNYWGDCDPNEPKNERMRCSICLQSANTTIVVDTGPDFRQQLNKHNINSLDYVLYTHIHGDHISGIDELRVITFRNKKQTPVYSNKETIENLQNRFDYLFKGGAHKIYPPVLDPHVIDEQSFGSAFTLVDFNIIPFKQDHGTIDTVGYRFGDFAYSVDMIRLDSQALNTLKGVKTWVVDCAAYKHTDNEVHANLETIYKYQDIIKAERVYLTSLSLSMDYRSLLKELPDGIFPAYDGLMLKGYDN